MRIGSAFTLSLFIHLAMILVLVFYVSVPAITVVGGDGRIKGVFVYLPGEVTENPGTPLGVAGGEGAGNAPSGEPVREAVASESVAAAPLPSQAKAETGRRGRTAAPEAAEAKAEAKAENEVEGETEGETGKSPTGISRLSVEVEGASEVEVALRKDEDGDEPSFDRRSGEAGSEGVSAASYSGQAGGTNAFFSSSGPARAQAGATGYVSGDPGLGKGGARPWGEVPGVARPEYPRYSRVRGEEGRVVLVVEVFSSGAPGEIKILRSSGFKRLDLAAVRAVERSVFTASQRALYKKIAFSFRLEDPE